MIRDPLNILFSFPVFYVDYFLQFFSLFLGWCMPPKRTAKSQSATPSRRGLRFRPGSTSPARIPPVPDFSFHQIPANSAAHLAAAAPFPPLHPHAVQALQAAQSFNYDYVQLHTLDATFAALPVSPFPLNDMSVSGSGGGGGAAVLAAPAAAAVAAVNNNIVGWVNGKPWPPSDYKDGLNAGAFITYLHRSISPFVTITCSKSTYKFG